MEPGLALPELPGTPPSQPPRLAVNFYDRAGHRAGRGCDTPACSVNSDRCCLNVVDRFRWACATAHFMTAPIRWRTRRAVSRFSFQIGVRTASTSAVVILSTGIAPSRGRA